MKDRQFNPMNYKMCEINHLYGDNIHITNSPYALALLAKLGHKNTVQPQIGQLLDQCYGILLEEAINQYFPRTSQKVETRMIDATPAGVIDAELTDPNLKVTSVSMARAGIQPSMFCYTQLHSILHSENLRQDHFYANRTTNESGAVTGVTISGSKIGGNVKNQIVLLPDPMGATGGTIKYAYEYYMNLEGGKPKEVIALHLIVTPEYVKRMKEECPNLKVISLRLDRGLSSNEILETVPGTNIDQEKGLTDIQYIVPGAGGIGEIKNNAFC